MPKVTQQSSEKSDSKSKAADAAKAAARLKICESSASTITPLFKAKAGLDAQIKDVMFKIMDATNKQVEKHSLDKTETAKMLTIALAKVYTDGDESAVAANMTANTLKSKFLRLAHPVDDKAKKQLEKALEKGVDFNQALLVARGKVTAAEAQKKGKKGGDTTKGKGATTIDDTDAFGDAISAVIAKALDGGDDFKQYKGGLSLDEMEETFATVLAGYRTKLEAKSEDDESED